MKKLCPRADQCRGLPNKNKKRERTHVTERLSLRGDGDDATKCGDKVVDVTEVSVAHVAVVGDALEGNGSGGIGGGDGHGAQGSGVC